MRSDLTIAIQNALVSFTQRDVEYLNMYLSGYNAIEIAARYITTTDYIEKELERLFIAIEEHSGYTDQSFVHKLELTRKYRKGGIRDLNEFLIMHSKTYIAHELKDQIHV